jgi:hypothetical protein
VTIPLISPDGVCASSGVAIVAGRGTTQPKTATNHGLSSGSGTRKRCGVVSCGCARLDVRCAALRYRRNRTAVRSSPPPTESGPILTMRVGPFWFHSHKSAGPAQAWGCSPRSEFLRPALVIADRDRDGTAEIALFVIAPPILLRGTVSACGDLEPRTSFPLSNSAQSRERLRWHSSCPSISQRSQRDSLTERHLQQPGE